jgi:hypothetical protein
MSNRPLGPKSKRKKNGRSEKLLARISKKNSPARPACVERGRSGVGAWVAGLYCRYLSPIRSGHGGGSAKARWRGGRT